MAKKKAETTDAPVRGLAGKYPAGIACAKDLRPFMGVEWDHIRTFPTGERFHIIAYRAYNAMGLIGSECNGVAIVRLPMDKRHKGGDVVTAGMAKIGSGYYGLDQAQLDLAYHLAVCSWQQFQERVNGSAELRMPI